MVWKEQSILWNTDKTAKLEYLKLNYDSCLTLVGRFNDSGFSVKSWLDLSHPLKFHDTIKYFLGDSLQNRYHSLNCY